MKEVKTARERGKVATNIEIPFPLWLEAKEAAHRRSISLTQLVNNGIKLALGYDDTVQIDSQGNVTNDLRGAVTEFAKARTGLLRKQ